MASITPPPPPHNFRLRSVKRPSCPPSFPRFSDSTPPHRCRCAHPSSSSDNTAGGWRWDAALNDAVQSAMRRLDRLVNLPRKKKADAAARDEEVEEAGKGEEWDWERWKRHFVEVDDRERLVSLLKSQLGHAIRREDYEDAARLKVAIAAAATNDTVGEVMSQLSRAIAEERYWEAAFLRDNAGAGLVGWWSGISEDAHDPYGLIVRITAEHGRYVGRSYNPGKLGTASTGTPLFEIFLTINKKSEYRQQAVYLRRKTFQDPQKGSSKATGAGGRLNPSGPLEEKGDIVVASTDDSEDTDDEEDSSDVAELLPGLPNILQDMIPGEKVKVLKVTAPAKDDRDFLSKVIEQIMDEEDKDQDMELEISEDENQDENDEDSDDHGRDNQERDDADFISGPAVVYSDDKREISVEVFVGGLGQKISGSLYESLRVPAKLEKKGRKAFSFSVEKDNNQVDLDKKKSPSIGGKAKLVGQGSIENVMLDLAKVIGKDKIPSKVLRDIIELIDHSISRAQNNQQLSGTTTFHRIELSSSPDPLSGLYLGAQGLHSSEVISLQRKFGQWHDNGTKETANLEFYEYVEAVKLTGDPYVPAGQVAFRAKVGKRYQLPHKGIIPEELGVIARYKGQGRLAEPGFQNPRWVDGELVILDGKFIKGVGFVYWAPKYQYLVFFNRLRLQ